MRARAWLGTIVFLLLAPGIVAGLVPWIITGWRVPDWGSWLPVVIGLAAALILPGIAFLLVAFARFALAGGTPAPPAPTRHLVVEGPYRHVRNPMYLAVGAIILGQVWLFANWWLFAWFVVFAVAVLLFVRAYEEPTLEETYGDEYRQYKANVPGWWPRLEAWRPGPTPED